MKKKSTRRNIIEWVIILGIIAGLYLTGLHTEVLGQIQHALLWTGIITPGTEIPSNEQLNADYNLTLQSFNNEPLKLSEFKGKTIFINFWASWCPPCRAEMPTIQNLYDKIKNENIAFVMVTFDSDISKAVQFIEDKNFTFPVYKPAGSIPAVYSSPTIPTTYVISPEGKIVLKEKGMADYDSREFINLLRKISRE